jgi:hypothetical protein
MRCSLVREASKQAFTQRPLRMAPRVTEEGKDSLGNKCPTWRNGRFHIVMPTQVGIHVFSLCWQQRRG